MAEEPKTTADRTFDEYDALREIPTDQDIPRDDIRDLNTLTTQNISREPEAADVDFYRHHDVRNPIELGGITPQAKPSYEDVLPTMAGEDDDDYLDNADIDKIENVADIEDSPLEDVPDADEIQENSPIDSAAPPLEDMHGTDLINGFNGEDPEEGYMI